jgi:hypothetical protein
LDRVDWSDRPAGAARPVNRTSITTEEDVLRLRGELTKSDLGDCGADAIRLAMIDRVTISDSTPAEVRLPPLATFHSLK